MRYILSSVVAITVMVMAMAASAAERNVALVLDASGSMNGKIAGGRVKIDVARQAVAAMAKNLDGSINLSLRAYGHQFHRREKNCKDTSLLVPFGPASKVASQVASKARDITAQGYTPISYVLGLAADDLKGLPGKRTIVLVSDGKETCEGDPCLLAKKLAEADAELTVHTVGLGVDAQTRAQLQCIADVGRGKYYDANSALELTQTMTEAAEAEIEETVIILKTNVPGTLIVENGKFHRVYDAETGENVATIASADNGKTELPAGIYNVQFGKKLFWKSIQVKAGETTVIKAGILIIDNNDYHHILDPETGDRYASYGTSDQRMVLPPGRFDVSFGKARWRDVEIKEGEATLLEPAELVIKNNGHHLVREAETNKNMATYSSSSKNLVLPGGQYNVMFGKAPWRVNLENGKTTVLDPAILVINNNQYHKIRDIETGKSIATYSTSDKRVQLVPGQYDVTFDKAKWRISVKKGEVLTLNPGGIGVRPKGYYKVFHKDGTAAGTLSSSDKQLMLPPGDYFINIADQKVAVSVKENKINLIKVQ